MRANQGSAMRRSSSCGEARQASPAGSRRTAVGKRIRSLMTGQFAKAREALSRRRRKAAAKRRRTAKTKPQYPETVGRWRRKFSEGKVPELVWLSRLGLCFPRGLSLPTLKLLAALAASSLLIAPGLADAQSRGAAPDNRQAESRSTAARTQAAGNVLGDPDKAAPDPSVKQGVLPNGLRYAVVSAKTPAKAISFRLYVNVGSYDETAQERGVAHFIEHMAFNGTKHIPEGRVDTMFGVKGVAFGRDQNAETGYFGTTYMLDVPQVDGDKLDLAFAWMRDIADGENLEQATIDRERGVILAEDDRSKGPERDWGERLQKFLSPELRTSTRDPIGTREVLNHANAALLRGFYEKWYRPDNAILVVVGDEPTEELEKRIGESFGSWTGKNNTPKHETHTTPNQTRSFDVLASTETALPTSVSLCYVRKHDQDIPDSQARAELRLERRLWRDVLNERLRAMAASEDPPFARAEVSFRESEHAALYACLDVLPLKDDWRRGFDAGMGALD